MLSLLSSRLCFFANNKKKKKKSPILPRNRQLEPGLEVSQEDADLFKVLRKRHDQDLLKWAIALRGIYKSSESTSKYCITRLQKIFYNWELVFKAIFVIATFPKPPHPYLNIISINKTRKKKKNLPMAQMMHLVSFGPVFIAHLPWAMKCI